MAHRRTTQKALIDGVQVKGFPIILNDDYTINRVAVRYLLSRYRGNALSSVVTYSGHLLDFLTQLEVDERSVDRVDDAWLTAYDAALISRAEGAEENTENYSAQVIRTVLHYLDWMEKEGIVRNLIGEDALCRVAIARTPRGIKHSLTDSTRFQSPPPVTPRKEWVHAVKAHCVESEEGLVTRFGLMMDWARVAGTRAMEVVALKLDQLVSRRSAVAALEASEVIPVVLRKTKGGRRETIRVPAELIVMTLDYVDEYRGEIVKKFQDKAKAKYETYIDPDYIFLSQNTGDCLSPVTFSNQVRKAYKAACDTGVLDKDNRVWLHGLRHLMAVDTTNGLEEAGFKNPEEVARHATRHRNVDSMDTYIGDRHGHLLHGNLD